MQVRALKQTQRAHNTYGTNLGLFGLADKRMKGSGASPLTKKLSLEPFLQAAVREAIQYYESIQPVE